MNSELKTFRSNAVEKEKLNLIGGEGETAFNRHQRLQAELVLAGYTIEPYGLYARYIRRPAERGSAQAVLVA